MEENQNVHSEVMGVLLALGNKYVERIPPKIMQYFKENCNYNTLYVIDKNKSIEEQNVSKDARMILTMLKLKFWCNSEEEKQEIIKKLKENDKIYQQELRDKYNIDNLFENNTEKTMSIENSQTNNIGIVKAKKNGFWPKLMNRIRNLFKRKL